MRPRLLTDEEGTPLSMYCVACKKWVVPAQRDHGIGSYEYWGSREVHHDWRTECRECDGDEFLDYEPETEETEE